VSVFDAPILEGAKQGIAELLSGEKTEELELSRKGLLLSGAGFATAAGLFAVLVSGAAPQLPGVEAPKISFSLPFSSSPSSSPSAAEAASKATAAKAAQVGQASPCE